MSPKYWACIYVILFVVSIAVAQAADVDRELVEIKAAMMSADYRGDLPALQSLRSRAAQFSDDPGLGYLADYWSGFASWRIVVNGANAKMNAEEAMAHLTRAALDFELSIGKKSDFADAYASDAAVHGLLAFYKRSDPAAMNNEIETFNRQVNKALKLEPENPRVLWVQAVPYLVLAPERGGDIDRAIELYSRAARNAGPLNPASPLPDWGKVEALMSLAGAHIKQVPPKLDAATAEVKQILGLQPDWHYVRDILSPQVAALEKPLHDFDFLLGDWEMSGKNARGPFHGYWSATRLDASNMIDEYRVVGEKGETIYAPHTLRSYNRKTKQWELVSVSNESGLGLQNFGTGHRDGSEMRIEQKFGPTILRIRYYDIQPDSFSWSADSSTDGGKTWNENVQQIQARRIGPPRSLALTPSATSH